MAKKTILAIDTATENCSVALSYNDQVFVRSQVAPQKHANLVLPMIEELLSEAGIERSAIEAIGFGAGPGSFTGVRIAVSTAQALALGLGVEVFGISDLKLLVADKLLALRASAPEQDHYALACIDARMGEVYFAFYVLRAGAGTVETILEEQVCKPEKAIELIASDERCAAAFKSAESLVAAGTGLNLLGLPRLLEKLGTDPEVAERISANTEADNKLYPEAATILRVYQLEGATMTDPSLAEPLYCRNEVTWKKIGEQ